MKRVTIEETWDCPYLLDEPCIVVDEGGKEIEIIAGLAAVHEEFSHWLNRLEDSAPSLTACALLSERLANWEKSTYPGGLSEAAKIVEASILFQIDEERARAIAAGESDWYDK